MVLQGTRHPLQAGFSVALFQAFYLFQRGDSPDCNIPERGYAAGRKGGPPPCIGHPPHTRQPPNLQPAITRWRPYLIRLQAVSIVTLGGEKDKPAVAQEANIVPFELRKTMAQMLGDAIALLAMKHRRAPLPVSSALLRTLWMRGFPGNLAELESFARRLLFLGDERMLLAELRRGRAPITFRPENSQEPSGIALGQRKETERGQKCQCLPTN